MISYYILVNSFSLWYFYCIPSISIVNSWHKLVQFTPELFSQAETQPEVLKLQELSAASWAEVEDGSSPMGRIHSCIFGINTGKNSKNMSISLKDRQIASFETKPCGCDLPFISFYDTAINGAKSGGRLGGRMQP